MKRRDWVLAVLAAAVGEPVTPVQLQKTLFLLEKECPQIGGRRYYKFTPYAYGPFDSTVYVDTRELAAEGLTTISQPDYGTREYRITEAGARAAEGLKVDKDVRQALDRIVEHVRSLSFRQLLSEIYRRFPDMRERSVFR